MWENVQVLLTLDDEECVDGTCDHCRMIESTENVMN